MPLSRGPLDVVDAATDHFAVAAAAASDNGGAAVWPCVSAGTSAGPGETLIARDAAGVDEAAARCPPKAASTTTTLALAAESLARVRDERSAGGVASLTERLGDAPLFFLESPAACCGCGCSFCASASAAVGKLSLWYLREVEDEKEKSGHVTGPTTG